MIKKIINEIYDRKNHVKHHFQVCFFFYFLEEDRKSASKERKSKAKAAVSTPPTTSSSVPSSPAKTPNRSRRFHPNLSPVSRTPTNSELLQRDPSWSMPEGEKLQWHQQQLYQVLGKGADYFLHPKIEKKAVKPINSKLRKEGGGCWSGLRYEAVFAAFYMLKKYIHLCKFLFTCLCISM